MLTEAEAKQKWCPWALTPFTSTSGAVGSHNRLFTEKAIMPPMIPTPCLCIASGCMAWRWQQYQDRETVNCPEKPAGEGWEKIEPTSVNQETMMWRRYKGERKGYCGNAGAP